MLPGYISCPYICSVFQVVLGHAASWLELKVVMFASELTVCLASIGSLYSEGFDWTLKDLG